jgi:hypothetical protein
MRADRVADEQIFDLAATIDQHGVGVIAQVLMGFLGLDVFHGDTRVL